MAADWYKPFFNQAAPSAVPQIRGDLRSADGEPIFLGPFNKNQAPFIECANCAQPITVGERLTVVREWILGITQSGRLVYVQPHDWEGDAIVHSDCSTEFAHDQITKDECGKDGDTVPCGVCGVPTDNSDGLCAWHCSALDGDGDG
jgi:hypothetical protein